MESCERTLLASVKEDGSGQCPYRMSVRLPILLEGNVSYWPVLSAWHDVRVLVQAFYVLTTHSKLIVSNKIVTFYSLRIQLELVQASIHHFISYSL